MSGAAAQLDPPSATVDGAQASLERLKRIDHIVVLMMENRSFDHMLGYLSLPEAKGGRARTDIDGLTGPEQNVNEFEGSLYPIKPMGKAGLTKVQDPCHSGACVGEQMANGMSGFVRNYATSRAYQDPGDVMRYQTAENVPVYDFFAQEFAVCDRWFCSVPGSTWPNRVSSIAGEAPSKDNRFPPLYSNRSFVRSLPKESWRWYSSDPGSLRLVDSDYRVGHESNFAFVKKPSFIQPRTFFEDVMSEDLPSVAWIDPNFVDLGGLQGAEDDHPPTDVMAGQSFVLKIYQVLSQSALWKKSMLVVLYDEHGGFYDHVDPTVDLPSEFTKRAEFGHFGPRVPAFVISPFVGKGAAFGSKQGNAAGVLFDHTALIKTILLRFANGSYEGMPERVATANDLGQLLTEEAPREAPPVPEESIEAIAQWWAEQIELQLKYPLSQIPAMSELGVSERAGGVEGILQSILGILGRLLDRLPGIHFAQTRAALPEGSELEQGVAAASAHIRNKGLRSGQP